MNVIVAIILMFSIGGSEMGGLMDMFNTRPAQEEREITGLTKEQQKGMMEIDKAQSKALTTMDYVKGNEGYRSKIYDDTKKLQTIGYGFNLKDETTRSLLPGDVVSGKRDLTKPEANMVFNQRFKIATDDAISYIGGQDNFSNLSDSQKRALIDMSYNMGLKRLNKFVELRKALFEGNKLKAKEEVLDSKYAREDVPNRALKNANLMLK